MHPPRQGGSLTIRDELSAFVAYDPRLVDAEGHRWASQSCDQAPNDSRASKAPRCAARQGRRTNPSRSLAANTGVLHDARQRFSFDAEGQSLHGGTVCRATSLHVFLLRNWVRLSGLAVFFLAIGALESVLLSGNAPGLVHGVLLVAGPAMVLLFFMAHRGNLAVQRIRGGRQHSR
jgi:hypothetical protein